MTGTSEFIFFLLLRKPLHSTSFRHSISFISFLNDEESKLQWVDIIQQSFWSFPLHSNHFGMTEWGQMKGDFWTKAKPLILKSLEFGFIPSFHLNILFFIGSFHSFEGHFVIPISFQFQINKKTSHADAIQLSRGQNERIGCCLYKRQHLILSFLGHSSVILTSFHEQYWTVLYLNETGMTEWQWNDPNGVWMK